MKRYLAWLLTAFLVLSTGLFAAYDPFAPKNQVTLWLEGNARKLDAARSLISQAGFSAVTGEIRGKALITNYQHLTEEQISAIDAYLKSGGKLILLGTRNFGTEAFLGTQPVGGDLSYLEIHEASYQGPKVLSVPKSASPVSIVAYSDGEVLAEYLAADGVTSSHIPQLNAAVLKISWGLYSGFDWFDGAFLDVPGYRQLFVLWLRKTVWN